jgi:hypothetical protein
MQQTCQRLKKFCEAKVFWRSLLKTMLQCLDETPILWPSLVISHVASSIYVDEVFDRPQIKLASACVDDVKVMSSNECKVIHLHV